MSKTQKNTLEDTEVLKTARYDAMDMMGEPRLMSGMLGSQVSDFFC